jgi:RNA polymerase sigma-70 factor (ECF subfamily)
MPKTPASLLERLRQPLDQDAWGRFAELYTPLLFYWARRRGLEANAAADLVQDVFLVLVRKLPEFVYDPNKSFRSFLRKVLQNKAREHQRRPNLPVVPGSGDIADVAADNGERPDEEAEYRRELVQRALELLQPEFPPMTWTAYQEYVVAGKPVAVVAADLGISTNRVYLAKSRVLTRLRQELAGLLDD